MLGAHVTPNSIVTGSEKQQPPRCADHFARGMRRDVRSHSGGRRSGASYLGPRFAPVPAVTLPPPPPPFAQRAKAIGSHLLYVRCTHLGNAILVLFLFCEKSRRLTIQSLQLNVRLFSREMN